MAAEGEHDHGDEGLGGAESEGDSGQESDGLGTGRTRVLRPLLIEEACEVVGGGARVGVFGAEEASAHIGPQDRAYRWRCRSRECRGTSRGVGARHRHGMQSSRAGSHHLRLSRDVIYTPRTPNPFNRLVPWKQYLGSPTRDV